MTLPQPEHPTARREFAFTDRDFKVLAALVRERSGIVLGANKKELVYSRLARRLRTLGIPSFALYRDHLAGREGQGEVVDFVNAITTNLTKFFREPHHFEHLRCLARDYRGAWGDFRIWSAGCSTGEEPYTIAMVLHEASRGRVADRTRILATDLDTRVLGTAREGRYAGKAVQDIPPRYRAAYIGKADGESVSMAPCLRQLIAFKRLNLLKDWPLKRSYDAIFCRNVLIYFSPEDKQALVGRFVERLKPGGHLYLGHSESLLGNLPGLETVGRTIYRKAGS